MQAFEQQLMDCRNMNLCVLYRLLLSVFMMIFQAKESDTKIAVGAGIGGVMVGSGSIAAAGVLTAATGFGWLLW